MLPGRHTCPGVVCLLLLACLAMRAVVHGQVVSEEQVKAAFVFRFAHYVAWPPQATDGRTTLEYCVWPPNPFGEILRELVAGEVLGGRRLVVRDLTAKDSVSTCHVLFLHGGGLRSVLERVQSQPVLTVSDAPRFLEEGGIIQLVRRDNRLKFNISIPAAERAGLRLSSHLLELAGNLRREGE